MKGLTRFTFYIKLIDDRKNTESLNLTRHVENLICKMCKENSKL